MNKYIAFTKKEFMEQARSYKLLVIIISFLMLGIMNPLTAKFLPDLLASVLTEGEGITIQIMTPVALDSWMQFFKNVPQMGLVILWIVFSQIMSAEIFKGTFINILTKGMPRSVIILSKFTASLCTWTVGYFLSFFTTYFYTIYLFSEEVDAKRLLFSVCCVWVFGLFILASNILGGVIFSGGYGGLLFTALLVVGQFIAGIIPKVSKYLPTKLVSDNMALIYERMEFSDFSGSLIVTFITIIVLLVIAVRVFNHKSL